MAFKFSAASRERLHTCHPALQGVVVHALSLGLVDITVIEGHRTAARQEEMLRAGKSKLGPWQSMHAPSPSLAVDIAPYFSDGRRIPWNDRDIWLRFAGVIQSAAVKEGVPLRWGGDWDGDWDHKDQTFHDLPHFEMVVPRPLFDRAIAETRTDGFWQP
jgi:peptidoglycan L-alanyl-D-glutamate endopeptidase CwlK